MIVSAETKIYSCSPTLTIREVLCRIDQAPYHFQVVVDDEGKLLGTITDGDIRRAMLRGISLDDQVRNCMHVRPVVGHIEDSHSNLHKLETLGSSRAFLPMLDRNGVVKEINVLLRQRGAGIASALIMAGGQGRRLGERTKAVPKPLLPVAGRPILDYVLANLEGAQIPDIYISVHYLADQIKDFVSSRPNQARVHFVEEPSPLGTAGALAQMVEVPQHPILIVNGDVVTRIDFSKIHDFHTQRGLDATICVTQHHTDIPFGVVRYGEDGSFQGIDEKPRISNFIAAGVYYLSPEFFGLVSSERAMDMPELLNQGRDIGLKIGIFPIHEYWTDVGRSADLDAADAEHRTLAP